MHAHNMHTHVSVFTHAYVRMCEHVWVSMCGLTSACSRRVHMCFSARFSPYPSIVCAQYAHHRPTKSTSSPSTRFTYLRNIRWLGGFVVFTVGQVLILVALGYGSQSLLSVLTSVQLVTNAM